MHDKSLLMLRLLTNRYHEGSADAVLNGLSPQDRQHVFDQHVRSHEVSGALTQPMDILRKIHYSWIIPKIEALPHSIRSLILSALPEPLATGLKNHQKEPLELEVISPTMKRFICNNFYHQLNPDEVLPLSFLPFTTLTPLGSLKKTELIELIDYLGLFDLGDEIRKIVDKKALQQIYDTLSNKKLEFLKKSMQQKDKIQTDPLNLEAWDGDSAALQKLLHQRGLARLGHALSGQHPDLVWHITHTLDIGRGKRILHYWNEQETPGLTEAINMQVQQVINFFNAQKGKNP